MGNKDEIINQIQAVIKSWNDEGYGDIDALVDIDDILSVNGYSTSRELDHAEE